MLSLEIDTHTYIYSSGFFRNLQESSGIFAGICRNLQESARICRNLQESARICIYVIVAEVSWHIYKLFVVSGDIDCLMQYLVFVFFVYV